MAEDLGAALREARSGARPGDLICVTGSLFLVAEALELASELGAPAKRARPAVAAVPEGQGARDRP